MWPFTDTGATRRDALSLWRETNGLLRELVEAIKGSESLTPRSIPTPRSSALMTSSTPRTGTSRKLSERDVTRVTRESLAALQAEAEAKRIHPHRVGEVTPPRPTEFYPANPDNPMLPVQTLSDPSASASPAGAPAPPAPGPSRPSAPTAAPGPGART